MMRGVYAPLTHKKIGKPLAIIEDMVRLPALLL